MVWNGKELAVYYDIPTTLRSGKIGQNWPLMNTPVVTFLHFCGKKAFIRWSDS